MRSLLGEMRADLLVMPELAPTGYFFTSPKELIDLAELPDAGGAFCSWIRALAAERDMVVIAGFAERDVVGRLYNSALIALPDGAYNVYRKSHLFYKEKCVFTPGDTGFFVTEWNGWRVGTMICYDWRFPESSRVLALRGADVIAHPSNLVAPALLWGPAMAMRAVENKVIVVTANRSGGESHEPEEGGEEALTFTGESRIIGMNGSVLAIAGGSDECVIAAEADPIATRRKSFNEFNDIFKDRRPELYR
jgi:predicted amidohydrolase